MIRPSVPVFCYHDTFDGGSHSRSRFREHVDAIEDAGFTTIGAAEMAAVLAGRARPRERACVLTFDDGHLSNFLFTSRELSSRGMRGVFFALADFTVPGEPRTEADAPAFKVMPDCFRAALMHQDYSQFINTGEIGALLAEGHEVHAHGCRHQPAFRTPDFRHPMGGPKAHWAAWGIYDRFEPSWPTFCEGSAYVYDGFWPTGALNDEGQPILRRRSEAERRAFCREDMARSFEFMRGLNGAQEQYFCWPWGQFDRVSEEELKRAGFAGAFTLERGANAKGCSPFRINRIGVGRDKDGGWIQRRLGMYRRAATARVFFKKFRKRPEIGGVLYATDSVKLSGGSRQLVNNAKAMAELGLDVAVMVPGDSAIASALPESARVVRCDDYRSPFQAAGVLRRAVRELGVDVVHTFHNKAYKAALAARAVNVLSGAGKGFRLFINRGVIFKPNALFGLWARLADGMIVNSFACADSLRRILVPRSRISVVHNSYIPEGPPPPDRAGRKKRGVRVLYVGNEAPAKGLDTFLRMAGELAERAEADPALRDVEFAVAGARALAKFDHLLTTPLRHRLLDLGLLPHAEVLAELNHADIFVLSSRLESLPNVLPEAFHAGLPVVCTRAGGVPELVAPGGGGLCEVDDHHCLAEKVRALVPDFEGRVRMGEVNRRIVSELLGNRRKGLDLLRVYHGAHLYSPLPLERMAALADGGAGDAGAAKARTGDNGAAKARTDGEGGAKASTGDEGARP
jgi:glycosyltransferase involved in cell wall biosynthesis